MDMRSLLMLAGIACGSYITVPDAAAQERRIEVTVYALAEFPLLRELASFDERYPTPIISEYTLLEHWHTDKWQDTSPPYFDLVAVVENLTELPSESVELTLTRDRKIGEIPDDIPLEPPHPRETAEWEGAIPIQTKAIGTLDGMTAKYVRFGPLSANELTYGLWEQNLWTWDAKYEVAVSCDGCVPVTNAWSFSLSFAW